MRSIGINKFVVCLASIVVAATLRAATISVTSTADSGADTLRDALANASDGDTIDATGISGTINLTTGELLVTNSVIIVGPGPGILAVDGDAASRVFDITNAVTVTITGLTVTNGVAPGTSPPSSGGGIYNKDSTLTLSNCTVSGSSAVGGSGGGLCNDLFQGSRTVTIVHCLLSGNVAQFGGAIRNISRNGSSVTVTMSDSTVSDNSAGNGAGIDNHGSNGGIAMLTIAGSTIAGNSCTWGGGGGILSQAYGSGSSVSVEIAKSTISGNSADSATGGAIVSTAVGGYASLKISNSTVSRNSAGLGGVAVLNSAALGVSAILEIGNTILNAGDSGGTISNVSGTVTSFGYNLTSDDGGGVLTNSTDQVNVSPVLGPLQDNGGPTLTHALLCNSPAIDAGDPDFTPPPYFDQRGPGFPRVVGGRIDIGAFEATVPTSQTFTVVNRNDSGPGSLRQAILDANAIANPGVSIIEIAPGAFGTIILTSGELLITGCLSINGPGASNVAVDGNATSRVFHIANGVTTTISGLTVTNGVASLTELTGLALGGGIYNDHSTLTVSNCVISGNSAADEGGGICNDGAIFGSARLTVIGSTFSGNSANFGGGICSDGAFSGSATLAVTGNTFTGNSAGDSGGGIYNNGESSGNATLTVTTSTFIDNSAISGSGGGIYNDGFRGSVTLTVSASTVSSNSAGDFGGGIYNYGQQGSATLTLSATTVSDSSASYGGGIYNQGVAGSASLTVITSTISGNEAEAGGGIYNDGRISGSATLRVITSTLSANSANFAGGGIYNLGQGGNAALTVNASTLSGNSADFRGGGIYNHGELGSAPVEIGDTILNAGASGANITNAYGTITSAGYNLSSDDGGGFLTGFADQINTDPMLGPLQMNGGPTYTHALLSASPAIDEGKRNAIAVIFSNIDQRGLPRPMHDSGSIPALDGDCSDIGAFEVQTAIPGPCPAPGPCPDLTGSWSSLVMTCKVKTTGTTCKVKGPLVVQNNGTSDAPRSFVRYYLSTDNQFDVTDTLLKQVATGTVKHGRPKKKTLSARLPIDVSGSGKFIIAVIDADNTVAECDENNNNIVFGPLP